MRLKPDSVERVEALVRALPDDVDRIAVLRTLRDRPGAVDIGELPKLLPADRFDPSSPQANAQHIAAVVHSMAKDGLVRIAAGGDEGRYLVSMTPLAERALDLQNSSKGR